MSKCYVDVAVDAADAAVALGACVKMLPQEAESLVPYLVAHEL